MGYRFCFGASGAGKTTRMHQEFLREAGQYLPGSGREHRSFLILVPEQFSMQTQKKLVQESHSGIMNIDVLSFGRLGHRLAEEIGQEEKTVLNDIGKSLILRRIATKTQKDLKILGRKMNSPGMVSEVKSILSEFMQYGVGREQIEQLAGFAAAAGQGALKTRLEDLLVLDEAFHEFEQEQFITSEETMDVLARMVGESELIRHSEILFDGFTGFTPVQNRVIAQLIRYARRVTICLDYAQDGGMPMSEVQAQEDAGDEQALFYLSRKTVRDITRIARKEKLPHEPDLYIEEELRGAPLPRFAHNPVFARLESALFRYRPQAVSERQRQEISARLPQAFHLWAASSPEEELRQVCIQIRQLTARGSYAYRDIAIVTGDLAGYGDILEKLALRYEIPIYIDRTRDVKSNALMETIRDVLSIVGEGFSYESVFRFLRSPMGPLLAEETDLLENYCLEHGIRGRKKWAMAMDADTEPLRLRFLSAIEPVTGPIDGRAKAGTAGERTLALYDFIRQNGLWEKTQQMADQFLAEGDTVRENEYRQIYRALMDLLDQIYALLGDERISAPDYVQLLETGFEEMRIGTLPQRADRVLCGDIERTRLHEIRVLFFVGVNDGNIPRGTSRGGLISDLDREFLLRSGVELAPTPRQQMYIQRLYLYMNLTHQTDQLYVSYAGTGTDGRSIRPSYLIGTLQQLFFGEPRVAVPEQRPLSEQLVGRRDTCACLAEQLRRYASGLYERPEYQEERDQMLTLYARLSGDEGRAQAAMLTDAAFFHYHPKPISEESARRLYGSSILGSISRMEMMAQCPGRQFLRYGLRLQERREYVFESSDSGTVMHAALNAFGQGLRQRQLDWRDFTPEEGAELVDEVLQRQAAQYRDLVLYSTARSERMLERMQRILERTVQTLQYQLRRGSFDPAGYEVAFGKEGKQAMVFPLGEGRELRLIGRIDRYDLCEVDGRVYIKVLDYKSGANELDPEKMKKGLQVQLLLYMDLLLGEEQKRHPGEEVVPAAMLYYRMDDPIVEDDGSGDEPDERDAQRLIYKKLRPTGMVDREDGSIPLLDTGLTSGSSDVIPVSLKKDGTLAARGTHAYTGEEFEQLREDVRQVICDLAREILDGSTALTPVRLDAQRTACDYCPYKNVCGFDPKSPGYEYRE